MTTPYMASAGLSPRRRAWIAALAVLVGIGLGFMAGLVAGRATGATATRVEAVKAGHARHIIVDEYGNTRFEWAPACAKPPAQEQPAGPMK